MLGTCLMCLLLFTNFLGYKQSSETIESFYEECCSHLSFNAFFAPYIHEPFRFLLCPQHSFSHHHETWKGKWCNKLNQSCYKINQSQPHAQHREQIAWTRAVVQWSLLEANPRPLISGGPEISLLLGLKTAFNTRPDVPNLQSKQSWVWEKL